MSKKPPTKRHRHWDPETSQGWKLKPTSKRKQMSYARKVRMERLSRESDILRTWGEICAVLQVAQTTAQRYVRELGMPVRKFGTTRNSRIVASKSEILSWYAEFAQLDTLKRAPLLSVLAPAVITALPRLQTIAHRFDVPPDARKELQEAHTQLAEALQQCG